MSNEAIRTVPPRENPTLAQVAAAKQYGKDNGYEGRTGGWIYNAKGRAIAHGWQSFASYLIAMGVHGVRDAR